ncbi:hypothetical protein [Erysipelothrix rhusiopathiae]|uniref:hypothetical protein n=1 Tax=Erysipelothrix rhusiopathiae TaxID=1648 RepID=UPI002B2515D3|nr:hypothetical protein [Erysipelothrix rhusiopathiae]WRB93768.1 hypothetical protein LL063_04110 [Erysipelothrix rhusiopathiae]
MNHSVLKDINVVNRTNRFLYYLRSIKPLRKVIYANVYENTERKKKLGRIVTVFHYLKMIANQFIYLFLIFGILAHALPQVPVEFIWFLLVIIRACVNTISSDDSIEKWTLIRSFKVDFKSYYHFRLHHDIIERILYCIAIMFTVVMYNQSVLTAFMMVLVVLGTKIVAEGLDLAFFNRYHKKISGKYKTIFVLALVLGFGALLFANYLSMGVFYFLTGIIVLMAITFTVRIPIREVQIHESYGLYMLQQISPEESLASINLKSSQTVLRIDDDYNLDQSDKVINRYEGYGLLNHLFLERHRRLWFKPLRFRFLVILAVISVSVIGITIMKSFLPEVYIQVSHTLSTEMFKSIGPYIFIVYLLNIGESMTRAYYLNCDSKLLNYAFYRRPEIIWKQFVGRLGTLVFLNIIPLIPIILGLFFMVGTQLIAPIRGEIGMFIVTLVLLSVFFSVHNLLMYYTLQPYNESMQEKGFLYNLMKVFVVMIAYNGNRLSSVPNLNLWLSIITAVYFIIGVLCVRLFSEKTFKIRK